MGPIKKNRAPRIVRLSGSELELLKFVLGRIAHDLRNPVIAMRGFAELALKKKLDPKRKSEYINRIIQELDSVNKFLTGLEIVSSDVSIRTRELDLVAFVRNFVAIQTQRLRCVGIQVGFESEVYSLRVLADPQGLELVFHCLLRNSEQALKSHCSSGPRQIKVNIGTESGMACVDIADTGPGVPNDIRDKIFEPLFSTRRSGGLGLGLSIARKLAKSMNGDVILMSPHKSTQGAKFRLMLPVCPSSPRTVQK